MLPKPQPRTPHIDPEAYANVSGALLRDMRIRRGFTVRQVAEMAKISKTTLMKLEAGEPVRFKSRVKVCFALSIVPDHVTSSLTPHEPADPIFCVRSGESSFRICYTTDKAPRTLLDLAPVDDAAERKRLGALGFVSGYFSQIRNSRPDTQFAVQEIELCSKDGMKPWDGTKRVLHRHQGEEFVYCLQGPVSITVSGRIVTLETGDSAFFHGEEGHDYALGANAGPRDLGRILSVVILPE